MIARIFHSIASRLRILCCRMRGMKIRGHVSLRAIEVPQRATAITLDDGVGLDTGVVLLATGDAARITIGRSTYINRLTIIDADALVEIGAQTMVGPFCYITDHDHSFGPGVAPATGPLVSAPTRIGSRCWIGAHVTILKGVTIGDGAVIGAGSVVTKPIPPGVIAVGNPARILKQIAR
jgi:acetyltransferase-like isoleucine patch superfamily enzyme